MKALTVFKIFGFVFLMTALLLLSACDDECSHGNTSETIIPPTHEEQGKTTVSCLDCVYSYNKDFVPPVGHTMKKEIHTPTCTEEGYTYNYCDCGYHFNTNIVPPNGHVLSEEEILPATCMAPGRVSVTCTVCSHSYESPLSPLGHELKCVERSNVSLKDRTGEASFRCDRCELEYDTPLLYSNIYKGAFVDNTQILAKGVDVSKHQHDKNDDGEYLPLDWAKIKAAGFDFAILRAGYMGSGNVGVTDPVYEMNYRDARQAGLDLGVYFYSYAYSVEDARAEAEFLLTLLDGKTFEYPIYFDIEDSRIPEKGLTKADLTNICIEFISILQENGYYAALYTNNRWLTDHLEADALTGLVDVWYARYATDKEVVNEGTWKDEWFGKQMAMWQFSHTGTIDGIKYTTTKNEKFGTDDVLFDLNYVYKDYPSIIKSLGYNGFPLEP